MSNDTATGADLSADLKRLVAEAEELLAATSGTLGDGKLADLRRRVEDTLVSARAGLRNAQASAAERARAAGRVADEYVHDNPWQSVGVAAAASAAVGLLVGLLVARR
jgi:ElaB/YqjD/DUF883 family membrane-anchored ribosome-binding protein